MKIDGLAELLNLKALRDSKRSGKSERTSSGSANGPQRASSGSQPGLDIQVSAASRSLADAVAYLRSQPEIRSEIVDEAKQALRSRIEVPARELALRILEEESSIDRAFRK